MIPFTSFDSWYPITRPGSPRPQSASPFLPHDKLLRRNSCLKVCAAGVGKTSTDRGDLWQTTLRQLEAQKRENRRLTDENIHLKEKFGYFQNATKKRGQKVEKEEEEATE